MKPGSRALVGFPAGKDTICFNAAKLYGSFLLPHVFANWKQIYSEGNPHEILNKEVECNGLTQPIHVLEKWKSQRNENKEVIVINVIYYFIFYSFLWEWYRYPLWNDN